MGEDEEIEFKGLKKRFTALEKDCEKKEKLLKLSVHKLTEEILNVKQELEKEVSEKEFIQSQHHLHQEHSREKFLELIRSVSQITESQ